MDSTGIKSLGDGEWRARQYGVQGRRQWRPAMDTATSDIRAVAFPPAATVALMVCQQTAAGQRMRPMTRVAATRRSLTGRPPRSSRSAGTDDFGKRTARRQSPETKPCAPPGISAGRSGIAGPDTTPAAGSRRILSQVRSNRWRATCSTSRLSATASPPETPTARPPDRRNPDPCRPHQPLQRPRHRRDRPRGLTPTGKADVSPLVGVAQQRPPTPSQTITAIAACSPTPNTRL